MATRAAPSPLPAPDSSYCSSELGHLRLGAGLVHLGVAVFLAAAAALSLAACQASPASPKSHANQRSAAADSPQSSPPAVMLSDVATSAKCPPGAPSHAECFQITVTGTTSGLGVVKSGGWLDVEAPLGSGACGQPTGYLERIVTSKGTLTVRAHGPRLCAGVVGTVHRSYTVVRGTGEMRRLHGHGLITVAVLANGAAETWTTPRG